MGAAPEPIFGGACLWYDARNCRGMDRCATVRSEGVLVKSICDIVGGARVSVVDETGHGKPEVERS
jgi:hypothetical protein